MRLDHARKLLLKMANTRMGGQALAAGHSLATDVDALGPTLAKPGTPMNAARTVRGPGSNPLTPAMPNTQMPPAAGAKHTPPPMQMPAPNQPAPGVMQQPIQQPQIPKMARAHRSILKMAVDAPPGGAPQPPQAPPPQAPPAAPPQAPAGGAPAPAPAPAGGDPSQAPQGSPPGAWKPSPLGEVLAGNPTISNMWMNMIHAPLNPPAPPPPSEGQQAASGQTMQQSQGLQAAYQQSGPGKTASHRIKTARQLVLQKLAFDPMEGPRPATRSIAGGYGSYGRMGAMNVNGRFQAGGGPRSLEARDPILGRPTMPFGADAPWGPNMTAPGMGPGLQVPTPEDQAPPAERWRTRAGMQATGPFNMPARYRGQKKNRNTYRPAPAPAQPEKSIGEQLQEAHNERMRQGLPPQAGNEETLKARAAAGAGGDAMPLPQRMGEGGTEATKLPQKMDGGGTEAVPFGGMEPMTDKPKQNTIYGPDPAGGTKATAPDAGKFLPPEGVPAPTQKPLPSNPIARAWELRKRRLAAQGGRAGQPPQPPAGQAVKPGDPVPMPATPPPETVSGPKGNVINGPDDAPPPPDVRTGGRRQDVGAGAGMAPPGQKFDAQGLQYGDDRNTPLPQKQLVRQTYGQPITPENANNVGANVIHGPGPSDVTEDRAPMGRAVPGRTGTYVPPNQTQDQRVGQNMPGKGSMPEGQPQYQDPRKVQSWARDPRQIQAGRNGGGIMRSQLNQNPYVWGYVPGKTPPPPPPRPTFPKITLGGRTRPAPAPQQPAQPPAPQPPAQVPPPQEAPIGQVPNPPAGKPLPGLREFSPRKPAAAPAPAPDGNG